MHHKKSQQGSVLLYCIVLLTIMSAVGVLSMQSATIQEKFSRNNFYSLQSYHVGITEQNRQYLTVANDEAVLFTNISAGVNGTDLDAISSVTNATFDSNFTYEGESTPPSGYSIGAYKGLLYEMNTESQYANIDAVSSQTLGFKYAAPDDGMSK